MTTEIEINNKEIVLNKLKPINDYWNKNFNIDQIIHVLKDIYRNLELNNIKNNIIEKLHNELDKISINNSCDKYKIDNDIYIYTKQIYAYSYAMACSCDMIPCSLHSLYEFIENKEIGIDKPLNKYEKILIKEIISKIFNDIKMIIRLEEKYLKNIKPGGFIGFKDKLGDYQLVENKLDQIKKQITGKNVEYGDINSTINFLKRDNYLIDSKLIKKHSEIKKQLYNLEKDEYSLEKRLELLSKELYMDNLPYLIYSLCSEENKTLIELAEYLELAPYTFIFFLHTNKIDYYSYNKICDHYDLDKKRKYIKKYCGGLY